MSFHKKEGSIGRLGTGFRVKNEDDYPCIAQLVRFFLGGFPKDNLTCLEAGAFFVSEWRWDCAVVHTRLLRGHVRS